jgi:hypothetical protein
MSALLHAAIEELEFVQFEIKGLEFGKDDLPIPCPQSDLIEAKIALRVKILKQGAQLLKNTIDRELAAMDIGEILLALEE